MSGEHQDAYRIVRVSSWKPWRNDVSLFVFLAPGGNIGALWYVTGTNGDVAGSRSRVDLSSSWLISERISAKGYICLGLGKNHISHQQLTSCMTLAAARSNNAMINGTACDTGDLTWTLSKFRMIKEENIYSDRTKHTLSNGSKERELFCKILLKIDQIDPSAWINKRNKRLCRKTFSFERHITLPKRITREESTGKNN